MVNTIKIILISFLYFQICLTANLQCYYCDSENEINKNCAINDNLHKKICKENEECYVAIDDKQHTVRGCASPGDNLPKLNSKCKTSLCNSEIYPKDRLACFQCTGNDCVTKPKGKPEPCKIYKSDDMCYTNVIDETDAVRGCASEIKIHGEFLITCKGNGCNNEDGKLNVTCTECNSNNDKGCKSVNELPSCIITNKNTCNVTYLLGRQKESCFTYHHFENVIRGCTINSAKLQLIPSKFTTCIGNLCNNKCLPLQKCSFCGDSSVDDPHCSINKIENCDIEQSSCYTCLNKNHLGIIRGCGLPPPGVNCQSCQGEIGCNIKPIQKCYKCNSENNSTCSGLPQSNKIETEICESQDSQCVTIINDKKFTERGCDSIQSNCKNNFNCIPCIGSYCNNDIIPSKRLKCHQCNGTECLLQPIIGSEEACAKYDENDECFEFKLNDTNVIRGCKSDTKNFNKCQEFKKDCKRCNSEGCNRHIVLKKKPILECYKCNSLDPHCRWTQKNSDDIKKCNSLINGNATEYCFSAVSQKNGTVLRGCSLDMNICMENNDECKICNENGCNKNVTIPQLCKQDFVIDGKNQTKKLEKKKCEKIEQYLESEGCYVKRVNKTVTWGCAMDLPIEELEKCKEASSKKCFYCNDINCDKMKAPKGNSANQTIVLSSVLMLFVLFTSFIF